MLLGWLLAFGLGLAAWGQEKKAELPRMPEEVTLTSGRVLRRVQVVRWERDRVVLRHAGGVDPVTFALFKSPTPEAVKAMREAEFLAAEKAREMQAKPEAAKPEETTTHTGQVFIVTKGAGNYKMGGLTVVVLPASAWGAMEGITQPVFLPKPLAWVTTDADGKFEVKLPRGLDFVLLAQGRRLAGSREEVYEWRVRSQEFRPGETILLSNDNHYSTHRTYRFDDK